VISRRTFTCLLPALLALTAVVAPACGSNNPTAPSAVTVVAFGDSITAGVGTTGNNDYVSLLSNRTGTAIINSGRSGDTTASALARINAAVLSRDADIVIVLLGGNDLLQGVPVPQRIANITTIVQQIRADGAAVILVGLGNGPLDPFEGALPGIATQNSSTLVPGILEGIFGVSGLMADLIHPNNAGHAIIADRIEPALRAALAAAGS
jgi:lysophospholipase L1-like esterase